MTQMSMTQMLTRPVDAPVVELDVRDDLRNKREPFQRILSAVQSLPPDAVLHLRAIFEPAPLYAVLGKKGFAHETESHAVDDWSVWFWRSSGEPAIAGPAAVLEPSGAAETWLDVRGLEPPEPMVRTLEALAAMPAGHTLVQVNVRVPQFLLPILEERGYTHEVDDSDGGRVLVRIRATNPTTPRNPTVSQPVVLDVRVIAPREKHPTIFHTFDSLKSGESMVIVNDHDPRPLRYQLAAERPDTFKWTYEEEGPETWRELIERV